MMANTNSYSAALTTVNTQDAADLDTVIAAISAAQTALATVMSGRGTPPDPATNAQLALVAAGQNIDLIATNLAGARASYPVDSGS